MTRITTNQINQIQIIQINQLRLRAAIHPPAGEDKMEQVSVLNIQIHNSSK
jgi:hypothetical protein